MRKPFIQSLGLLLAGVMLLAMAGCSALDNFLSPSDWQAKGKVMPDNRKTASDSDVKQPERIDILIEALDKKDAAQFKSVFSETALELADDMDRGIEYIFGLYRGSYVKTPRAFTASAIPSGRCRRRTPARSASTACFWRNAKKTKGVQAAARSLRASPIPNAKPPRSRRRESLTP